MSDPEGSAIDRRGGLLKPKGLHASELYRLVRQLREQPRPSRNRQFDELSQPMALAARKLVKRLDGLERELKRSGARVSACRHERGVLITLDYPEVKLRRAAYLTHEEHALLADDPQLAAVLALE
jgi:hypothetical protein